MKIVHLCLSAFFIDNYSYQENMLPKYHVKQGHEVTVIASLMSFDERGRASFLDKPSSYFDSNGFKVVRLAYKKPEKWNRLFRHYVGLKDALIDAEPDVIFMHCSSFGDTPIVRWYLNNHPQTLLYADNHADYINSASNWLSKHILHKIVWRYYTKVVEPYMIKYWGVTPMRCRFVQEMYGVNPNIVDYLPLGVDDDLIPKDREAIIDKVRSELGILKTDFVIVSGGKIGKPKNIHILIESLREIDNPKIHLILCGVLNPEMEYLKESFDNNKRIHYLGWCNAERVMECMIASNLACFPGTHSTLWEQAVGVGIPSIFKRWPEMEHVNVNGNCVFVKGEDKGELIKVITNLTTDEEEYNRMNKFAKEASRNFLYSEIAKKAIGINI